MNQSLQYHLTEDDVIDTGAGSWSRPQRTMRSCASLALFAIGTYFLVIRGIGPDAVLCFCLAALIVYPIPFKTLFGMGGSWLPTDRVVLTDDAIRTEAKNQRHNILWSSVARFGSATEHPKTFVLDCGRGNILIPKRAFASPAALHEFRTFVNEKLGDRCKFNASSEET